MEKFDYIIPLETLHKNHVKAYKEYCKRIQEEKERQEKINMIRIYVMLGVMIFSIELAFLSYFIK